MDQNLGNLTREFGIWLEKAQKEKMTADSAGAGDAELKNKWLEIVEQMKQTPAGSGIADMERKLQAKAPEVREAIAKLLYEGKLTEESMRDLLEDRIGPLATDNACLVCTVCTACVTCALCIITGIAAASVTGSISTASTNG